jgi:SAM-dependent methyltransferase
MKNTFDTVVSFGVLHHTSSTENAIREVYRVLKPDGTALIMLYARGWKHYIKRCFIHGLLLGKYFRYGFSWQKVYNEVSEVHGSSPKTGVYNKRQVKKLFSEFPEVQINKKRLGEFFEYKPYNTLLFPKVILNLFRFLNLESFLAENWFIRAQKKPFPKEASLFKVIFKHY